MPQLVFKNKDTGATESHDVAWYRDFLDAHVHRAGLQIGPHLDSIQERPVFVVAATGVGKTVGVPVHLLLLLCERLLRQGESLSPTPFVLVVEPTIPICRSEGEHMNSVFRAFLAKRGLRSNVSPFGVVTGPYKSNTDAPIRFITTGVFERMAERIDPNRCRVVIDEAHRVLAQSPGVEIAACLARNRGVIVDWMSATVDASSIGERFEVDLVLATEQRYPILKVPTNQPLEECVGALVVRCLVRPDEVVPPVEAFASAAECERVRAHLLSSHAFEDPVDGRRYPGLLERPQGMLVVVNSHRGENSDTRRIADLVSAACAAAAADVEVLRLASPVVRDPVQAASFRRRVAGVETRRGRYVVIATNVVEMGVTFPSLDYVVTMDTELETVRKHGSELVQERPLGANAFFQRIGRVGRRRPGMALITREGEHGAQFSAWTLDQLTTNLQVEPITFATLRGDVRELAFFLYEREVTPSLASDHLRRERMPSRPESDVIVMRAIEEERAAIRAAGLSNDGVRLNSRGNRFRRIGVVRDLEIGGLLAYCLESKPSALRYLALVTAANPGGLRDLLGRHTWLDNPEPVLSRTVRFARHQFRKPLAEVASLLGSAEQSVDPKSIGCEAAVAQRLTDLMADGYNVDPVNSTERAGVPEESTLLTLSRATIPLDQSSELLAAYDIVSWFFRRYRTPLTDGNLAHHERDRVRAAVRDEARMLGVDAGGLFAALSRLEDIARRARLDLGRPESPARISEAQLSRLTSAAMASASDLDAATLRRDIIRAYRGILQPRPTVDFPNPNHSERKAFVDAISRLGLFVPCELVSSEDARGWPVLEGTATHMGESVSVSVSRARTSLRPSGRATVRGRVLPLPYQDRDGNDAIRYTLTLTSVVRP